MSATFNESNSLYKRATALFGRPRKDWSTIDEMIYGMPDYFRYDTAEISRLRFKAIKESLEHHYTNSRFYAELCKEYNFNPADVKTIDDLKLIPMLPDTFFKEYPTEKPHDIYKWLKKVATINIGEYDYKGKTLAGFLKWAEMMLSGLVIHSSGTSGHHSFMFWDKITYQRFYYAAAKTILSIPSKLDNDPHFVYTGSPNTFLTFGRWLGEGAKVFSEDRRHFLTDHEISMLIVRLLSTGNARSLKEKFILWSLKKAMLRGEDKMIRLLCEIAEKGEQAVILSPPFQLYDIMLKMRDKNIKIDLGTSGSIVFTGGGWKIFEHSKITNEKFASMITDTLGIPADHYVDIYGMSEMNGLGVTCKGGYKHLTPWIYPMVLDESKGYLGYGEYGRFAFLDPVANSYPGFIMTGDRVKLHEKCPVCDKSGFVIDSEISRMKGAESKGCSNLMRDIISDELKKAEKKGESK